MSLPLGATSGPDHVVELLNAAAGALLGVPDGIGRPLRDVLPGDATGLLDALDSAYRDGETTRWGSLSCVPRRNGTGVTGLILHGAEPDSPTSPIERTALAADPAGRECRSERVEEAVGGTERERTIALFELARGLSSAATPRRSARSPPPARPTCSAPTAPRSSPSVPPAWSRSTSGAGTSRWRTGIG